MRGVAREVATAYGAAVARPALVDPSSLLPAPYGEAAPGASIADPAAADLFIAAHGDRSRPDRADPAWMRARLVAGGMRPISLAVDVTNYVMLETRPAAARLRPGQAQSGPLTVRRAVPGRRWRPSTTSSARWTCSDLVIADDARPARPGRDDGRPGLRDRRQATHSRWSSRPCTSHRRRSPRTARRHKLSSEASRRFERGVDRVPAPSPRPAPRRCSSAAAEPRTWDAARRCGRPSNPRSGSPCRPARAGLRHGDHAAARS